jgi:hypothetical protein
MTVMERDCCAGDVVAGADQQQRAGINVFRHIDDGAVFGEHGVQRHHRFAIGPGQHPEIGKLREAAYGGFFRQDGLRLVEAALSKDQARHVFEAAQIGQSVGAEAAGFGQGFMEIVLGQRREAGVFPGFVAAGRQAEFAQKFGSVLAALRAAGEAAGQTVIARQEFFGGSGDFGHAASAITCA